MLKNIILFCIFSVIFSAPTSCNFQKTNVLSLSEDEDTITLENKKSCYEKNICTFSCKNNDSKCKKIIYFDLGTRSSFLENYKKVCLQPKSEKVQQIFQKHFIPIAKQLTNIVVAITMDAQNIRSERTQGMIKRIVQLVKQINDVDKNVKEFLKKVKRICAQNDKLTPSEQVKILLGVDIKGFENKVVKAIEYFIQDSSEVLAENCECRSFIHRIPSRFRKLVNTLCQKECKRL